MANKFLSLLSFCVLLNSCAQIVNPTGGSKDQTAPEVVSINPANKSIHFSKESIEIKFNEFIQLNNPEDQIIISPPLSEQPEYINKGKSLQIKLRAPLKNNTTYTINFGNAIGDNTENNQLNNLNYVFSTGDNLDSNFISGSVVNAFTDTKEKSITVALYDASDFNDSSLIKNKPIYLGKTNESGDFYINNLPLFDFYLFAFKDDNKNLKLDKNEQLAYHGSSLNTSDSLSKKISLKLFKPDAFFPSQLIDTFSREPNKFQFIIYKPSSSITITRTDGTPVYIKKSEGKEFTDTLIVYSTAKPNNTYSFLIQQHESTYTVDIHQKSLFKEPKLSFQYQKQPELKDSIHFHFNTPILSIDTTKLILLKDSLKIPYQFIQKNAFECILINEWEEKKNYKLIIGDSTFIDFYKQPNKKEQSSFTTKSNKDYANLLLHVKVKGKLSHQVLIQLISKDELKPDYQYIINQSTDLSIPLILPGSYRIKYIYDSNNNGKWDNGDLKLQKQPEEVRFISNPIQIKAYWDLEQSVLID